MRVLSFDQALSNTGYSCLDINGGQDGLTVVLNFKGVVRTAKQEGRSGFYDTIPRGDSICRQLQEVIQTAMDLWGKPDVIVHEMPMVMSKGSMSSRESPIIAVTALRATLGAVLPQVPIVIQQNQRMKKIVCGFVGAEKHEVKEAVMRHLGVEKLKSNEHEIDAIALAIAAYRDGLLHDAISLGRGTVL